MAEGLDIKSITNKFALDLTEKVADFAEIQLKQAAQQAARRAKKTTSRSGKVYRYKNTGQLARNINTIREGKKALVSDGTRADYSSSYHGMYFLVEKKGMSDVKRVLKDLKGYTETLKL